MNSNDAPDLAAIMTLLDAHATIDLAAQCLSDYIFDPAAISSPAIISACDTIIELGADDDPTTIAESLAALCPPLAKAFCACEELCPIHFSDPENCAPDH